MISIDEFLNGIIKFTNYIKNKIIKLYFEKYLNIILKIKLFKMLFNCLIMEIIFLGKVNERNEKS